MAKQRYGINDAYRGTVGTVIGYEWRGKWCLRARPLRVHNPRTAKQQANRMLFKQMVALAGRMKSALRTGLHGIAMQQHVTECNLFVKRNKGCFSLEGERLVVDWERLVVSEGDLVAPVFCDGPLSQPQAAASSPNLGEQLDSKSRSKKTLGFGEQLVSNKSHLSSSPNLGEGDRRKAVVEGFINITIPFLPCPAGQRASGDDAVYVYAYCPEMKEGILSAPAWRRSGSVQLTLPERWRGKEVHFYGFAVNHKDEASPSVYLGRMDPSESEEDTEPNTDFPTPKHTKTAISTLSDKNIRLWKNPY